MTSQQEPKNPLNPPSSQYSEESTKPSPQTTIAGSKGKLEGITPVRLREMGVLDAVPDMLIEMDTEFVIEPDEVQVAEPELVHVPVPD